MIRRLPRLQWNLRDLSAAMHLTPDETVQYFTDGRRVSFLLERRIRREIGGQLPPNEGAAYDVVDPDGRKWEVRSITWGGIYFCPSYMVGSGRSFNEAGFFEKMEAIQGYIVSDVVEFPAVPVWKVATSVVRSWYQQGELGANTKVSRARMLSLLGV